MSSLFSENFFTLILIKSVQKWRSALVSFEFNFKIYKLSQICFLLYIFTNRHIWWSLRLCWKFQKFEKISKFFSDKFVHFEKNESLDFECRHDFRFLVDLASGKISKKNLRKITLKKILQNHGGGQGERFRSTRSIPRSSTSSEVSSSMVGSS